jgi:hypothetical protein
MNELEHVFPLPEVARHKLDEAKEEIVHPISRRIRRGLAQNAWMAIGISMVAGLACGVMWGRRG